jgi:hypothetical protein
MTDSVQENPRNSLRPHAVFRVPFGGKNFVLIPYWTNLYESSEPDRAAILERYPECLAEEGVHGIPALIWPCPDGRLGYFPGNITELQDFAGKYSFEMVEKSFQLAEIRCSF